MQDAFSRARLDEYNLARTWYAAIQTHHRSYPRRIEQIRQYRHGHGRVEPRMACHLLFAMGHSANARSHLSQPTNQACLSIPFPILGNQASKFALTSPQHNVNVTISIDNRYCLKLLSQYVLESEQAFEGPGASKQQVWTGGLTGH